MRFYINKKLDRIFNLRKTYIERLEKLDELHDMRKEFLNVYKIDCTTGIGLGFSINDEDLNKEIKPIIEKYLLEKIKEKAKEVKEIEKEIEDLISN